MSEVREDLSLGGVARNEIESCEFERDERAQVCRLARRERFSNALARRQVERVPGGAFGRRVPELLRA